MSAATLPFLNFTAEGSPNVDALEVHIFSKHLQFLPYRTVGEKAAELGFAGVDLTVRPNGHVEPENVAEKLPEAVEEIRKGGSVCKLITTAVESAEKAEDLAVLQAASKAGVQSYRCNWFEYNPDQTMEESLLFYQKQVRALSELNRSLNLVGCYQNHAGTAIGSSIWEVKKILETALPDHFGSQFDIRHATVEGGLSWPNSLRLIHPYIRTIVLKDFKWAKVKGKWVTENVPIGEGMIDFKKYFALLKQYKIRVPVCLHMEYALGGAEHGHRQIHGDQSVVFEAMKKDLAAIQKLWQEA